MSDKKVSKPSKDEFYHGAVYGNHDKKHVPWGVILAAILSHRRRRGNG